MGSISSRFCIIEPSEIRGLLQAGEEVELTHTMDQYATSGRIQFTQEPSFGDDGCSWEQSFRAVVRQPSILKYNCSRHYLGIFRTDGSLFVIGSADLAPLIVVTPYEDALSVEATFGTAEPAEI